MDGRARFRDLAERVARLTDLPLFSVNKFINSVHSDLGFTILEPIGSEPCRILLHCMILVAYLLPATT